MIHEMPSVSFFAQSQFTFKNESKNVKKDKVGAIVA